MIKDEITKNLGTRYIYVTYKLNNSEGKNGPTQSKAESIDKITP